jgi:hypothetical protein
LTTILSETYETLSTEINVVKGDTMIGAELDDETHS